MKWGDWTSLGSALPFTVDINVVNGLKSARRKVRRDQGHEKRMVGLVGSPAINVEGWPLNFKYGDQTWDTSQRDQSKAPYCNLGDWDNGGFGDFVSSFLGFGAPVPVSLYPG